MFLGLLALGEALARKGDGVGAFELVCSGHLVGVVAELGCGLQARLRWLRGITYRALGDLIQAERLLTSVRDGYTERGDPLRAAFVTLDLLAVLAAQGKHEHVLALTEVTYRIFAAGWLEAEALGAVAILRRTALARQVTEELAVRVANFVLRRQHDREARFE